jgi:AcrR family transcriptional regulator
VPDDPSPKPLRADAQRNYDAIVRAAALEIERVGAGASLEDIARNAGVGSATLHRRFRNRRELLQAVFADRIKQICSRASTLSSALEPGAALRAWLLELTVFSASTRGVADTLILEGGPDPTTSTCEAMLAAAASALHDRAVQAGEADSSVSPLELLALVNSISLGSRTSTDPASFATRLLTIALDGAASGRVVASAAADGPKDHARVALQDTPSRVQHNASA